MRPYRTGSIAETNNYIVLEEYTKLSQLHETPAGYQSEADLEEELLRDLQAQGYSYIILHSPGEMLANARTCIERLNDVTFTDAEWDRFTVEYLDRPSDTPINKTEMIQTNHVYDFTFDDGHVQNIYLVDKERLSRNYLQVTHQYAVTGLHDNRYDVTILVNGLPLVQIELKRRGVALREAFNQIHRYSKESFNLDSSLYRFLQLFVISNGTDTRYFANILKPTKGSYDFTMNWATARNQPIKDLKDFTATFLQKRTLLEVLLKYTILNTSRELMTMRPYQIAATERILWKIRSAHEAKQWSTPEGGGYIWHTTGSGKTLTSFKAAQLATGLDFIRKVFFVVDRKDLDNQTMTEYKRFSPDSITGTESTRELRANIERPDDRIIVTTIQKLNNLMKSEPDLGIYDEEVVFIFDEAHRSQFGEAQRNLRKRFRKYYQFGFTGTPIFPENALGAETTGSVFGTQLHAYVITDAIRDEKVLRFKVDYNDVRPRFKSYETETDPDKLSAYERNDALLHPERIREISRYILDNFRIKTGRTSPTAKGFNAMLAASSVDAAKLYYETLTALQAESDHPLQIATIFSYSPNEEQSSYGEIEDESFEPTALSLSGKEFLHRAIMDYNAHFGTSYDVDGESFQLYYRDLSERVKRGEVDLLIVVGMFLTGFDAPGLNTLFVDKNLRYHGLIQAYSRTNRILDATKPFGNIITFRDLEQATIDAITLFGKQNTRDVIIERSYEEYLHGFTDPVTGEHQEGYDQVVTALEEEFPEPDEIVSSSATQAKAFVNLFGKYLRLINVLQNYDEYTLAKELATIDLEDKAAVEHFRDSHFLTDEEVGEMAKTHLLTERRVQDYKSTYNDIIDKYRPSKEEPTPALPGEKKEQVDWSDVVFEVELLKSQEIDLDYILGLILDYHRRHEDKEGIIEEIRRVIRSSLGNRAKEGLVVDFIRQADLDSFADRADIIGAFFTFARSEREREVRELIDSEQLKEEPARRYLRTSLRREFASRAGTDLYDLMPDPEPLDPDFVGRMDEVHEQISRLVDRYAGVGGDL